MSIGLQIQGRLKSRTLFAKRPRAAEVLERVSSWFEDSYESGLIQPPSLVEHDGQSQLSVQLLPGIEPVMFSQSALDRITVSASTGWGGPGYHKQLCEALRTVGGEFGFEWIETEEGDETGFFGTQDWEKLDAEVSTWIQRLCEVVLDKTSEGMSSIQVGLPIDIGFTTPGFVLTPLGPRDRAWFETAAEDTETAKSLLAWTTPSLDALAWRGHAVAAMWQDVGWHRPRTENEARTLAYVLRALDKARQLDSRIGLPEREWEELKSYAVEEEDGVAAPTPPRSPAGLIGYRRWPVIMRPFAGWGVTIPGEMSAGEGEEEGTVTWFDEERSVHFSTFGVSGDGGSATPEKVLNAAPSADGEILDTWKHDGCVGRLSVADAESDEGEPYVNFTGLIASRSQLGVCTVTAGDREQIGFAKQVCRSITVQDQNV